MVNQYVRCEETAEHEQQAECKAVMQSDVREIYNAARILDQQRQHEAATLRQITPLQQRIRDDSVVLDTGIAAAIGGGLAIAIARRIRR